MSKRHFALMSVLLLIATSGIAGGAPSPSPLPPDPTQPAAGRDTVVIGMSVEPDVLHPLLMGNFAAGMVMSTIQTVDINRDQTWRHFPQGVAYLPRLAEGT